MHSLSRMASKPFMWIVEEKVALSPRKMKRGQSEQRRVWCGNRGVCGLGWMLKHPKCSKHFWLRHESGNRYTMTSVQWQFQISFCYSTGIWVMLLLPCAINYLLWIPWCVNANNIQSYNIHIWFQKCRLHVCQPTSVWKPFLLTVPMILDLFMVFCLLITVANHHKTTVWGIFLLFPSILSKSKWL